MKKALSLFLCFVMLVCCVPFAFAQGSDIKIDGSYAILVVDGAGERDTEAAGKLQEYISLGFGLDLEIVTSASANYIAVGAAASKADISDVADNGYRILADGENVLIAGTGVRGTIHGVYRFLEEFAGLHIYTSALTVFDNSEITVPAGTDIVYEPFFEYADTDWLSPRNPEYSLANGLTGGTYRSLPSSQGGTVNYLGSFCHTLSTSLCSADKYYEEHPEYFAVHEGKSNKTQLCLTNPDVLEIVTNEVLDMLARGHDPEASVQIVSLTQNDNYNFCECEKCKAFEDAHGGVHSATMINFVNGVADAVAEAGYDNVAIDTFAYQYTRQAPTGIVPRDNVIVRLCTIECCFCHALDDSSCERNVALMKDLTDWSKICNRIYIWDYTTNYAHTISVFPDFGVIQRNIQVFYEYNAKGVYEEGAYYMDSCNVEFGELRSYLISKCLQDPYCDYDAEMNGFLDAYYGEGGKYVREAIDYYTDKAGTNQGHLGIYEATKDSLRLTEMDVYRIDQLWEAAKEAAKDDETALDNICRSEISWRCYKSCANQGEFSILNPYYFDENEKLYDDLSKYGCNTLSEGGFGQYQECGAARYLNSDEFNGYKEDDIATNARIFFGKIWEVICYIMSFFGLFYGMMGSFNNTFA